MKENKSLLNGEVIFIVFTIFILLIFLVAFVFLITNFINNGSEDTSEVKLEYSYKDKQIFDVKGINISKNLSSGIIDYSFQIY
jgi:hypothetical protein